MFLKILKNRQDKSVHETESKHTDKSGSPTSQNQMSTNQDEFESKDKGYSDKSVMSPSQNTQLKEKRQNQVKSDTGNENPLRFEDTALFP